VALLKLDAAAGGPDPVAGNVAGRGTGGHRSRPRPAAGVGGRDPGGATGAASGPAAAVML
jgi:hypothetical protein